jgi:hypothetical protein
MKLNRLIAASIVGISLLAPSTSAFACEHDSHSWSFFGWCSHSDKDKDCDHKDCDNGGNSGGHDCNHGGSSSSGSGSSSSGSGSSSGGSSSGGSSSGGSSSGSGVGPKG